MSPKSWFNNPLFLLKMVKICVFFKKMLHYKMVALKPHGIKSFIDFAILKISLYLAFLCTVKAFQIQKKLLFPFYFCVT